jgi:hypothetical protein
VKKPERRQYLKNAYRVLLTRARQGMVIFVPPGAKRDRTRQLQSDRRSVVQSSRLHPAKCVNRRASPKSLGYFSLKRFWAANPIARA